MIEAHVNAAMIVGEPFRSEGESLISVQLT